MSEFRHYRVHNDHQIAEIGGPDAGDASGEPQHTGKLVESMLKNMEIRILARDTESLDFEIVGIDASIANALRRIMLAEVPTVAIETVYISVNTSIIQDEVLSHRIGLVPINVDPNKLEDVVNEEETDKDTVVFHLDAECRDERVTDARGKQGWAGERVMTSALTWMPQGAQLEHFPEGVGPVHDDILLAQLRPGQRIEFEAHARRGIGKDHAKFSPVATASYRLLPDIRLPTAVTGDSAQELRAICPMQVFDIEDLGGTPTAVVARPQDCSMCRECIRRDGWEQRVELRRKADHFIFSVESAGQLDPATIVTQAIAILKEKALKFQDLVVDHEAQAI